MAKRHRLPTSLSFNMTPLIDIVFQLIIFFLLATQLASGESKPIELPKPEESVFNPKIRLENRRVLTVCYANPRNENSEIRCYLGGRKIDDLSAITEDLQSRVARDRQYQVVIRADRRVPYEKVRDLMAAVAKAEVVNLYLTAEAEFAEQPEETAP